MLKKIIKQLRLLFTNSFLESLLLPFVRGNEVDAFIIKIVPNHDLYPKGSIRKVSRKGIIFYLDISHIVDWFVYFEIKEKAQVRLFNLIHKGDYVIDVGGNIGAVTLNCAKIVGETGKVYTFEPHKGNFSRLTKNLLLNNFKNIVAINKGLGIKENYATMVEVREDNPGMNRIISDNATPSEGVKSQIEIISLDSYIRENNIKEVNMIKIDVEGFEMNVLQGANETLLKHRPKLFIELDDNNLKEQGSSAKALLRFLEKHKYHIIHAEEERPLTSANDFSDCHFDIIAKNKL